MTYKLQEICTLVNEKISINDIMNSDFYISTENMLPDKGGVTSPSSLPSDVKVTAYKRNDVLISNIRPYFKKIWFAVNDGGCSNDVLVFRAKRGISPNFLHYVLADDAFFEYAMKTSKGTKMPRGDKKAIMEYEILMFDLETQQKISSILSALDGKIELNNRINENLEQQAQAILKKFMDTYDYVFVPLSEIANVIDCLHSKKPIQVYDSKRQLLQLDNIKDNGFLDLTCKYMISESDYKNWTRKCEIQEGDCVITNVGRIGAVAQAPKNTHAAMGRNMTCIRLKKKYNLSAYFITVLLSDHMKKEIQYNTDEGTIMGALNVKNIPKLQFPLFDDNTMQQLESILYALRKQFEENSIQNQSLSALRDTLLPKFMNGGIDVENVKV